METACQSALALRPNPSSDRGRMRVWEQNGKIAQGLHARTGRGPWLACGEACKNGKAGEGRGKRNGLDLRFVFLGG